MSEEVEITELIDSERTAHNNLVSEFNEVTADRVAGKLIDIESAERAMGERVGVSRSRLLVIPGGLARLLAGQERETIISELRTAIAEAVDALRPIAADEVTSRDIVELPEENEEE